MPACGPFVDWQPRPATRPPRASRARESAPHPPSPPAAERDVRLRPREDMDMDRHLGTAGVVVWSVDSGLRDADRPDAAWLAVGPPDS